MKLFKYKKFLAFFCVLILLFVFLCFPVSASSTFLSSNSKPYFTPGNIAFNYTVYNLYDPYIYYVSHSFNPILGDYTDLSIRDELPEDVYNTDQSSYAMFVRFYNDYITYNPNHSDLVVLDDGSLSGLASFSFNTEFYYDPSVHDSTPELSSIVLSDFYCWNNDDLYDFTSEIALYIANFSSIVSVDSIEVVYRDVGTTQLLTNSLTTGVVPGFLSGNFEICPEDIDGNSRLDAVYYVDSLVIHLNYIKIGEIDLNGYFNYIFYPGLESYDLEQAAPTFDDNPAFSLTPYTTWLANAVGGFMDFEIYHNFTLGGIFMTIIAFACCVWFLKLVAGG